MGQSGHTISRRGYLALGLGLPADILTAQQHARDAVTDPDRAAFSTLTADEARVIEALTSQIIPTDSSPGAREAGVVYFIDQALASFDADKKDRYREGVALVNATRAKLFPAVSPDVSKLTTQQQVAILQAIEKTEFFDLLRTHTVLGFFGDPSYGGNRNRIGWKHIGFEHRMAFAPPFGYYDARKDEA